QHLERLEIVLGCLEKEGLKAKLEKCSFFKPEVKYLGHVISADGVAMDPVPTWDQRAETVVQILVDKWFYKFVVPGHIHSDQGLNFESALLQQLCDLY
ncbi:hypothetical protein QTP70_021149, partial [Hemibagrus guttatus]